MVNIITSPPEATEFRLRTAVGSDGINQQRASIGIAGRKLSELLSFSRDFSTGFRADRDYRNLQFASTTKLVTGLGTGTLNLAYMDHPFGADQFYGNFNSWEDTKTWFAGAQQAIGLNTTASFAFRRHSDLFVLYRDRPQNEWPRDAEGRLQMYTRPLDVRALLQEAHAARLEKQADVHSTGPKDLA